MTPSERDRLPCALCVQGLRHEYPDGTRALTGVDLKVGEGERVALLGPNGAGKSTLMLHLNGVLKATSGSIEVAGLVLSSDSLPQIRSTVGLVFQDPDDQLFMTTVYDDVAFGPLNMGLSRQEADRRVHDALHDVGLSDLASKPGQHLSFGQKKRVALATVLSMRPGILALDEPSSNLDPRARREMLELLKSLRVTLLVATHDMDLVWRLCDRTVIMDEGLIVADGATRLLLADESLLEEHGLELPPALAAGRSGG